MQGVKIPEPLRKYLPGAPDFIPYPVAPVEEKKDKEFKSKLPIHEKKQ